MVVFSCFIHIEDCVFDTTFKYNKKLIDILINQIDLNKKKQKAYRITDRLLLKLCIVKRNDYEIEIRLILIFKSTIETIKLTTVIIIKPIICGMIWFKVAL